MNAPGKMLPQAMKSLFRKPATIKYPLQKAYIPKGFRGKLTFDPSACVGCKLCTKDCPSHAIEILPAAEGGFKAVVHLDKCIYCGQCADSCRKGALHCTNEFELAAFNRGSLTVEI
jgi:formate hydrogenlyase subunit 6/NADH:ubiquinone oxidoreductase subunit I